MIIAIDGPAASGKSTVAKTVAERLGLHYLDTGAMYRAVALAALERGIGLDDEDALTALGRSLEIRFEYEPGACVPTRVLADGRDVTAGIRAPAVDAAVSAVARVAGVRDAMVGLQRRTAADAGDAVVEGRDIGTVVFPSAEVKVFLTASPEERARRRHDDRRRAGHGSGVSEVLEELARRDALDSARETSPLAVAEDAVVLDTTGLTADEVAARVVSLAEEAVA